MRWVLGAVASLGLFGCSEYDFVSEEPAQPVRPNPLELDAEVQTDRIRQVAVPEVDVLFVIDNSCSMWEEQTALAANFPSFIRYFLGSGLDWHIGVVSTDMENLDHQGRLRQVDGYRFIDEETPDPVTTFSSMAMMGTTGHWDEEGLAATFSAVEVEGKGFNTGFVRDAGAFHTILISDEDDYSDAWDAPEFLGWLSGLRWATSLVSFNSIVGPEQSCPGAAEPGDEYLEVTRGIGGVEWSICSDAWAEILDQLGLATTKLEQEFFLSRLPVEDTIAVQVVVDETVTLDFTDGGDWVYDQARNSIRFLEFVPQPTAEVVITYDVLESL